MKRFLITIISAVCLICILIITMNRIYVGFLNKLDSDYTQKFQEVPDKIQVCNLGSSHGLYGFCYDDIDKDFCFNFSLVSQTLEYDNRILSYYEDRISAETKVIIPVSYFSFFGEGEQNTDVFQSKNLRYYKFLPKEYISYYSFSEDIQAKLPLLFAYESIADIFYKENENDNIWSASLNASNYDAGYTVRKHVGQCCDEKGNVLLNPDSIEALYSMIDICKEKGARPILITTPFTSEYLNGIMTDKIELYDAFYKQIGKIVDKTGVEYYDYSFDERFSSNLDYFMDVDHLNKKGAKEFTKVVLQRINKRRE